MSTKLIAVAVVGAVAAGAAAIAVAAGGDGSGSDDAAVAVATGADGLSQVDEAKDRPEQDEPGGSDVTGGSEAAGASTPTSGQAGSTSSTDVVATTGTGTGTGTGTSTGTEPPSATGTGTGGGAPFEPDAVFGVDADDPFVEPDADFERFPASASDKEGAQPSVPTAGPWTVTNHEGRIECTSISLAIPSSPPERGVIEVLDGGRTLIGTGLESDAGGESITVHAVTGIRGRYAGTFDGTAEGVPVAIDYVLQVVRPERMVGHLSSSFSSQGQTCEISRPFELDHAG